MSNYHQALKTTQGNDPNSYERLDKYVGAEMFENISLFHCWGRGGVGGKVEVTLGMHVTVSNMSQIA